MAYKEKNPNTKVINDGKYRMIFIDKIAVAAAKAKAKQILEQNELIMDKANVVVQKK